MVALQSPDQMQAQQYAKDMEYQRQNDQRVNDATNSYNQAQTGANTAQGQLQDFTKNMTSGTDMYAKQLGLANQNAGYDVNNLNQAQNQVSQITGIMGGLPRAIQASNANYGATAGSVANQYATTGANLNQSLQLANQNTQNQLQKQAGGLTGAQAATSAGIQTQDQQRQGYAAAAANATNIMQNAQTQMDAMVKAQQNGQQLTAQDQAIFGQLKASYAAAAQSYAAATLANSQAAGQNLTNQRAQNYMGSSQYQDFLNGKVDANGVSTTAQTPANTSNPWYNDPNLGTRQLGSFAADTATNIGNAWNGLASNMPWNSQWHW